MNNKQALPQDTYMIVEVGLSKIARVRFSLTSSSLPDEIEAIKLCKWMFTVYMHTLISLYS